MTIEISLKIKNTTYKNFEDLSKLPTSDISEVQLIISGGTTVPSTTIFVTYIVVDKNIIKSLLSVARERAFLAEHFPKKAFYKNLISLLNLILLKKSLSINESQELYKITQSGQTTFHLEKPDDGGWVSLQAKTIYIGLDKQATIINNTIFLKKRVKIKVHEDYLILTSNKKYMKIDIPLNEILQDIVFTGGNYINPLKDISLIFEERTIQGHKTYKKKGFWMQSKSTKKSYFLTINDCKKITTWFLIKK